MIRQAWSVVHIQRGVVYSVSTFDTEPKALAKMEELFEEMKKRGTVSHNSTIEDYNEGSGLLEVTDSLYHAEDTKLPLLPEHQPGIEDRDSLLLFLKWYFGEGRRDIDVIIGGLDGYGSKNVSISYPDELDIRALIAFLSGLTTIMITTSNLRGLLHCSTVDLSDVEDEDEDSSLFEDKDDDVPF